MSATLLLPEKLDLRAAGPLRDLLLAETGGDLELDASRVTHLGALSLQVIRAAARTWGEAGHTLTLTGASTNLADQMSLLGFTTDSLTHWERRP
ncbi:STAS domain-containing protein [Maritimibacter sp. DP1N21-5]|uniref:STAS domain-containing protein n=1 Tax=Maritimibacter sp. DP1N21-5 TaxID=2836867 RepID=UPI001C47132D|nr:STAS domain-containing protein [Maritimibacter sp. DP1N21-5]MBV7409863.1 STAS domain-containing protein [Maritimibacter sp. DP1N21-5]